MRPSNKSRSRNKPGNNGHGGNNGGGNSNNNPRRGLGNIINRVFESAGPDGKVRGTPQQIIDKYQALARDAQVSGDRVAAENYLQHSEHYSRLLGEAQREQGEQRFNQNRDEALRGDEMPDTVRDMPRPQPQLQQPRPQPSFGLTMIDPEDSDDFGGPIETPEGNRRRAETPVPPRMPDPVFQRAPAAARYPDPTPEPGATEPATAAPESGPESGPESTSEPTAAKRPRTRRKAKVETGETAEEPVEHTDPI